MLRIRLRRTGRKNRPSYRIVVAEHSAPLTGHFVDQLGHFDPRTKEFVIDNERLTKWLGVGAQPSNRVAKLLTKTGFKHKLVVVKTNQPRATRNPEEVAAAPVASAVPVEAETAAEPAVKAEAEAVETKEEPTEAPTEEAEAPSTEA